ncbi:MAG: hypothetical protein RLO01_13085 [Thalassobaculaceae bacterium]
MTQITISHADANTLPFLQAIGPIHREHDTSRDVMQDAIVALHQDLDTHGYTLEVVQDLNTFTEIVRSVGKFVPNAFDPKVKPARPGDTFGLVLRDAEGAVAATNGCRLYRLGVTTLADHMATLSLFYANPVEQMARGERLIIDGPANDYAMTIDDKAIWVGCFWVRPDLRKDCSNASYIMPFAARLLSAAWWGRLITFSILENWVRKPIAQSRLGEPDIYEHIRWFRPHIPDRTDMLLMVTEPDVPIVRCEKYVAGENRFFARPMVSGEPRPVLSAGD